MYGNPEDKSGALGEVLKLGRKNLTDPATTVTLLNLNANTST